MESVYLLYQSDTGFFIPVNYTVTAANASTQTYTVTVVQSPSSGKAITEFSLAGSAGTISSTNIAVTVAHGTDLSSIVPTLIAHNGVSISPAAGDAVDFTVPVNYTVTAADSTTQTYTIVATEAPASSKNITSFSVVGVEAIISGTNISAVVPYGTDISNLTPAISHTGASINPVWEQLRTFTWTYNLYCNCTRFIHSRLYCNCNSCILSIKSNYIIFSGRC